MQVIHLRSIVHAAAALALCAAPPVYAAPQATNAAAIDFGRDIRPILSDACFACHGPDAKHRKAKLRLDLKAGAMAPRDGGAAITPGDTARSLVIQRITSKDPDLVMPPPDAKPQLTAKQIDLLRRWVEQGADWREHWAFVPAKRPTVPKYYGTTWVSGPIDAFIYTNLRKNKLTPSPEAGYRTLLRRVSLDLTGLPPTVEELDEFVYGHRPHHVPFVKRYEQWVDRLLASPRFGEHMARYWLDAARYGDTHGLHLDNYREMWPYRDWVVGAFNRNLPFDQFVVEQLAGDLLPNATLDQQVATGFNRCHVTTGEGGSIKEEVYVRNVIDRVDTVGTVFLGMTIGCARCHDHKYDPLTMTDYYGLFAYFNSLDGNPLDGNKAQYAPVVRVPGPGQHEQLADLRKQLADAKAKLAHTIESFEYVEPTEAVEPPVPTPREVVWIEDDTPPGVNAQGNTPWRFVTKEQGPVFSGEKASTRTAQGLSQHFFDGAKPPLTIRAGDVLFTYVYLDPANPPKQIMLQWNDGSWDHRAYWGGNHIDWGKDNSPARRRMGDLPEAGKWTRLEVSAQEVGLKPGAKVGGWAFTQFDGTVYWDKAGVVTTPDHPTDFDSLAAWSAYHAKLKKPVLPKPFAALIKKPTDQQSEAERKQLRDYFIEHAYAKSRSVIKPLRQRVRQLEGKIPALEKSFPVTMVWKELAKPRQAYMLDRGEYDKRKEPVGRATPTFLPAFKKDWPNDRLGFARWLTDPAHPLTARVAVNRFWQQAFGVGLVKTAEDFGSQGDPPTHPELLDWLAVQFVEDGWDVKRLMKRIVMSNTYRQSSRVTEDRLAKDPANRLLSRGPRFRLDAEVLRDQALAVSGLLVTDMGGPSVKPPQPDGLWFAVGYSGSNTVRFKADAGPAKVHRRTLYTFIKRTAPPPQMSTFDGPSRESCIVRRERTNTPLQALLMMNDPQYFEAALALAVRAMTDDLHAFEPGGMFTGSRWLRTSEAGRRAWYMFCRATGRDPTAAELADLIANHREHLSAYKADPGAAKQVIAVGTAPLDPKLDPAELAAWTMVANLVLNLDEVLTKE